MKSVKKFFKLHRKYLGLALVLGCFSLCAPFGNFKGGAFEGAQTSLFASKSGVTVVAEAYNAEMSQMNLHRNLLNMGYQPVQLDIKNNTSHTYILSDSNVSLPSASVKEITRKVTIGGLPRSIGFSVASFFFWPFHVVGAANTISTFKSNSKLKKNLVAKSVKEGEDILPFSTIHRVLYVPKANYQKNFTVTLVDKSNDRQETLEVACLSP